MLPKHDGILHNSLSIVVQRVALICGQAEEAVCVKRVAFDYLLRPFDGRVGKVSEILVGEGKGLEYLVIAPGVYWLGVNVKIPLPLCST